MSFNPVLSQHGYRVPIPRSPKIEFAPELLKNCSENTSNCIDEEIPGKYYYMELMGAPRKELKELFIRNCNQARWQHIRNAEVKAIK